MRFVSVWLLAVGTGVWAVYLIGWLVGLVWPPAQRPIYFTLAALWGLIGVSYAWAKLREAVPFHQTPGTVARGVSAFSSSLASAYCLSFAADMFFGRLFGIFPDTVWMPIGTWSVISSVLLFVAAALSKARVAIVLPWLVMGAYVLIGTVAGPYPHRYFVTLALFAFAAGLLGLFAPLAPAKSMPEPDQQPLNDADIWHPSQIVPSQAKDPTGERPPAPAASGAAARSREPEQKKPQSLADYYAMRRAEGLSPSQDREAMKSYPRIVQVPCPTKPVSEAPHCTNAEDDVLPAASCTTSQGREPAEPSSGHGPATAYASRLKATQVARIRAIAAILKEVEPKSDRDWIEGFAMDAMPEREIACWEVMALAYGSFTSQHDLSLDAKQEVLQLALSRSLGRTDEQVLSRPANVLSEPERRDVLDHFSAAARALGTLDEFA